MFSSSSNYTNVLNIKITMRKRTPEIRPKARAKPTRLKPNNPSLIESDQNEGHPRPRPNCHKDTKSNPPSLIQWSKSTLVKLLQISLNSEFWPNGRGRFSALQLPQIFSPVPQKISL